MAKEHFYSLTVEWTGNKGEGTSDYRSYDRAHRIIAKNKPDLLASSDPAFRGDSSKYNPEELLVASLSGCHMLWFLHLCADKGVIVVEYIDKPTGTMVESTAGGGHFKEVILNPTVTVTENSMLDELNELHIAAHKHCFISNSVNFPVKHVSVNKVKE